jgi:glycosyltransferase involved in cell wall biosynthesis
MKRVLFLYTELAEYFLSCLEELEKKGLEIHVVRWPVNTEAPFAFRSLADTQFYERNDYDDAHLVALAENIAPDLIITSGWVDKGYLAVNKRFKGRINTVLLFDNHWLGSLKQHAASLASRFLFLNKFSHAWIPGEPQYLFARKLGFAPDHIVQGFYCADLTNFNSCYNSEITSRNKELLYVGRYLEFKGIHDLWAAFTAANETMGNTWNLICLGTGDLWNERAIDENIEHVGFVQPTDLGHYISRAAAFVLPSHKEPWGVVAHEMAAAGLPLLCSDKIGAATLFLEDGKNGYSFESGNEGQLQHVLEKFMSLEIASKKSMSEHSHALSERLTPEIWTQRLFELL